MSYESQNSMTPKAPPDLWHEHFVHVHKRLDEIIERMRKLELWKAGIVGFGIAVATLFGSEAGETLGAILLGGY